MKRRRLFFIASIGLAVMACASETLIERVRRETAESMLRVYAMEGYPQTFPEIVERLRREAESGDPVAQSRLGELHFFGFGVTRDPVQRASWHRKAAEGGHALSQYFLAWIYLEGDGLEQDYRQALEWLRRSGVNGWEKGRRQYVCLSPQAGGQPNLAATDDLEGLRSALPEWAERYFASGISWWSNDCNAKYTRRGLESFFNAANAGDPKAQYMVGVAYLSGRGIALDRARAGRWFLRAARQGHGAALREYCALNRTGATAPEDPPPDTGWCQGVPSP